MAHRIAAALATTILSCLTAVAAANSYHIETLADELDNPWSLAFLPDGALLVTERPGQLNIIRRDGSREQVSGVPAVHYAGQGGLLDVVLHPQFPANRWVYLVYAGGDARQNATHIGRGRLDGSALQDFEVLLAVEPLKRGSNHYGGRLVFLADGTFMVTTGDGFDHREDAQKLGSLLGKTLRLNDDGSIPADNPFAGRAGARPEIYSYGHRNPQGLVYDAASDRIYLHEHGPRGGDEINLIEAGVNYGWPIATHGIDYSGAKISPYTEYRGTVQPLLHWTPSIAPSGMTLYRGEMFPAWQGDLLSGALVARHVRRVDLEDGKIKAEESLFGELNARIRDVREGPQGALYLLTDEGGVLRVTAN